jgi:hypothetical protein
MPGRIQGHYVVGNFSRAKVVRSKTQPPAGLASGHPRLVLVQVPASSRSGLWAPQKVVLVQVPAGMRASKSQCGFLNTTPPEGTYKVRARQGLTGLYTVCSPWWLCVAL